MKNIPKSILNELYHHKKLNPYEIGDILKCDHKTVRRYIKLHNINTRDASEYNFLSKGTTYTKPEREAYTCKKSAAAHIAYLCEGCQTNKATSLCFCNTNPLLCDLIIWCLNDIYKVRSIRLRVLAKSTSHASGLLQRYPEAKFMLDKSRKTPLLRVFSGGRNLVRDFVNNAYDILYSLDIH